MVLIKLLTGVFTLANRMSSTPRKKGGVLCAKKDEKTPPHAFGRLRYWRIAILAESVKKQVGMDYNTTL